MAFLIGRGPNDFDTSVLTGTALTGGATWSDTHINANTTSTYNVSTGRHTASTSVSSQAIQKNVIYVRLEDGSERKWAYGGGFGARPGNVVSCVFASMKDKPHPMGYRMRNHTTGEDVYFAGSFIALAGWSSYLWLAMWLGLLFCIGAITSFIDAVAQSGGQPPWMITRWLVYAAIFLTVVLVWRGIRQARIRAFLRAEADGLIASIPKDEIERLREH